MATWREQLNLRSHGLRRREPFTLADALRSLIEGPDRVAALVTIWIRLSLFVISLIGAFWLLGVTKSASPHELVGIIVLLVLGLVLQRWLTRMPADRGPLTGVAES